MQILMDVYRLLPKLPDEEKYGLRSQLRRAAISIPLNIAEGYGRGTRRDYAHFVTNSRGSTLELDNALDICVMLGFLKAEQCHPIQVELSQIERMLTSLRLKLLAMQVK
jgi:four helix bundle protein